MAEHTPGPWAIVKAEYLSHDAPGYEQVLSPGGIMGGTADEPSWVIEGEIEWEPNARLIAAAPEMLEALHRCVEVIEFAYMNAPEQPKELAEARAAIAKAAGG